jgi:hypothetical protein
LSLAKESTRPGTCKISTLGKIAAWNALSEALGSLTPAKSLFWCSGHISKEFQPDSKRGGPEGVNPCDTDDFPEHYNIGYLIESALHFFGIERKKF